MTTPSAGPPPNRGRDTGRAGVYAGEEQVARLLDRAPEFPVVEVAGSRVTLPTERHFGDLAGVRRYVEAVLALPWVRERWAAAARPVAVRERRGASRAHYEFASSTIAIPVRGGDARWALRELVVLHEIAHHLGAGDDIGHGAQFRERMLAMTAGVMADEVAFLLRIAWIDQGLTAP